MQIGCELPHILQAIWEADPSEGPVQVSKIDVTDVYHQGTLWTSQVGTFTYVGTSAPDDYCMMFFVNIVLLMGWADSPKFFC